MEGEPQLIRALRELGSACAARAEAWEVLVIGGTALLLLGSTTRTTGDVDIAAIVVDGSLRRSKPLPQSLLELGRVVAERHGLPPEWLDTNSTSLLELPLPLGLLERCSTRAFGGLTLYLPAQCDLVALKLYAAASSTHPFTKHERDLRHLIGDGSHISAARTWCLDVAPQLEGRVHELLSDLRKEAGQ